VHVFACDTTVVPATHTPAAGAVIHSTPPLHPPTERLPLPLPLRPPPRLGRAVRREAFHIYEVRELPPVAVVLRCFD